MAFSSTISATSVLRGNISGDGSVEVLGRVEGHVTVTGDVRIGPDASVVGAVSGARIVISGSVEGDVTGAEAVVLEDSGSLIGDLSAPRVSVAEGACLRGAVRTDVARASRSEDSGPASVERAALRDLGVGLRAGVAKRPPPPVVNAPRAGRARKRAAGRR
jgi:cytoskeletal protein CcmA (bactofilin family)